MEPCSYLTDQWKLSVRFIQPECRGPIPNSWNATVVKFGLRQALFPASQSSLFPATPRDRKKRAPGDEVSLSPTWLLGWVQAKHLLLEKETLFGAQNNGRPEDNFWREWRLDRPKTSLTGHVDRWQIISFLNKRSNPPMQILGCPWLSFNSFCLLSNFLNDLKQANCFFFQYFNWSETRLDQAQISLTLCLATIQKLFWALLLQRMWVVWPPG